MTMTPEEATRFAANLDKLVGAVEEVLLGKNRVVRLAFTALLSEGHLLLDDVPGTGKTSLARAMAQSVAGTSNRVQFTPDLLPGDITGAFVFDQREREFEFRPGPIFTGLLLADEINRTPPKTQAALLEAMQERQVTVEGHTFPLPQPFHVLATANPVEYEGTYPLPEAQLDRFLMRVSFGYPSLEEEWRILEARMERRQEEQTLRQVATAEQLLQMQRAVEATDVDESVGRYCVALTAATRTHGDVLLGASPRGALGLLLSARAYAVVSGRDYVLPEDVKAVAPAVLSHRVTVRPELWMSNVSGAAVVASLLRSVPTPAARERRAASHAEGS
jgi:MoxR-like ATPase